METIERDTVHTVPRSPTLRRYMTPGPHTIARNRSLSAARLVMLDEGVRHLPVLESGRVVGVLSERDLLLVESLPGVNPTDVRVEEAMVEDVFTAGPDAPLVAVVRTMIARKLGSAVIIDDDGRVVGVFTTVDALRALRDLLDH